MILISKSRLTCELYLDTLLRGEVVRPRELTKTSLSLGTFVVFVEHPDRCSRVRESTSARSWESQITKINTLLDFKKNVQKMSKFSQLHLKNSI